VTSSYTVFAGVGFFFFCVYVCWLVAAKPSRLLPLHASSFAVSSCKGNYCCPLSSSSFQSDIDNCQVLFTNLFMSGFFFFLPMHFQAAFAAMSRSLTVISPRDVAWSVRSWSQMCDVQRRI
jgi:hypothetical protein